MRTVFGAFLAAAFLAVTVFLAAPVMVFSLASSDALAAAAFVDVAAVVVDDDDVVVAVVLLLV